MGTEVKEKSKPSKGTRIHPILPSRLNKKVEHHQNKRMIGKNTKEQAVINLLETAIAYIEKGEQETVHVL